MCKLSADGGFPHPADFSPLLHRDFPGTPLVVERLERVARIIGFNPSEIFVPGEPGAFDRVPERSWERSR